MLPKRYRLKNKKAFDATYKNREIISNKLFTIYLGKEKKDAEVQTKFGFVVSKKYHKRATKRNRIKRLMREFFRLSLKNNAITQLNSKMSVIVIPKPAAIGINYKEVEASLEHLIKCRLK